MSASLVGSEMCIRDRHSSCVPGARNLPKLPGKEQRPERWMRSQGFPVSYTHLTLPTICSV
eukprot:12985699-Alexandrium_andersonii.AAC.1